MRLMFSAMANWAGGGYFPSEFRLTEPYELIHLFVIYGFGFAGLILTMLLLHWHSLRLRNSLSLNNIEVVVMRGEINLWAILAITGFCSGLFAAIMPDRIAIYAGFFYFNLPITMNLAAYN